MYRQDIYVFKWENVNNLHYALLVRTVLSRDLKDFLKPHKKITKDSGRYVKERKRNKIVFPTICLMNDRSKEDPHSYGNNRTSSPEKLDWFWVLVEVHISNLEST